VIVPPDPEVAFAAILTSDPVVKTEPGVGAVIAIVGNEFPTFTVMALEVTLVPTESTAVAVSEVGPEVVGVHGIVNGAVVTVPSAEVTPPTVDENETEVIVVPSNGAADAVTDVAVPTVAVELLVGAVSATLVPATAVTVMGLEVAVPPVLSITRAVMVAFPATVGAQETE